jgi:hypothetical protein
MQVFTLSEYLGIIPDETKKYVRTLLSYLYYNDTIEVKDVRIYNEQDLLFYKSIKSYRDLSEKHKNKAQLLQLGDDTSIKRLTEYSDSQLSNTFTRYYQYFTPFAEREEYYTIQPEDIINKIFDALVIPFNKYNTFKFFHLEPHYTINKLLEEAKKEKDTIISSKLQSFNKDYNSNVCNYFDTVGKIYMFLRGLKNNENIDSLTNEDKKNIAMFLAIYYYNGIPTNNGSFDEQKVIISYLESKGITKEMLEKKLCILINMEALNQLNPALVLYSEFGNARPSDTYKKDTTVTNITNCLIKNGYFSSIALNRLFGELGISLKDASNLSAEVKKVKEESTDTSIDDLYNNLMPNVISLLKRLTRIYTYLQNKLETLNPDYVKTENDLITLSLLIAAYEFDNDIKKFFEINKMTLDSILSEVRLPKKEEFYKELNATQPVEKNALKFKNLLSTGHNYDKNKDSITVDTTIRNIDSKDRVKSSVVHKLYNTLTGKKLGNEYGETIKNSLKKVESERKDALAEELLKDVSIDVYNYLRIISDYYIALKDKGLSQIDREQLSIIFAAARYNHRIEEYLESMGITRSSLSNKWKFDFKYTSSPFDIDIISKHFTSYIFDRPKDKITVYTIFENAFKPELINSLNLRRVLFEFGKEPEDFIGIEAKITAFEKEKEAKKVEEAQDEMFNHCDDEARKVITDTLLVHEFLSTNLKPTRLVTSEEDLKELSLLISLLLSADGYIPFFTKNGITLDKVVAVIGIEKNDLLNILRMNVNKSLITKYKDYFTSSKVDVQTFIAAIFDDGINESKVIERITAENGNDYSILVEEVTEQKEKDLTPEQGIEVLSAEEVQDITEPTLANIVDYGSSISKHSKYINDALQALIFADTLDQSVSEINNLLSEISYEETKPARKQTFFEKLFSDEPPVTTIKKYNPEKIGEVGEELDVEIAALAKELKSYAFIKKYIDTYLRVLNEYLQKLKQFNASLELPEIDTSLDEITQFSMNLDQTSTKRILEDKINAFETRILLMRQELITVHQAIINHFVTINALQTSKMAILPLIATEMAIAKGKETEGEALMLTGELVSLLGNIVNKNVDATRENLSRLRLTSLSDETYKSLNDNVGAYLESVDKWKQLLNPPKEEPSAPTLPLGSTRH